MPTRYTADPMDARCYQAERLLRVRVQDDPRWQGCEPWFISTEHAQVYVDLALSRVTGPWFRGPVKVEPARLRPVAHYRGAIYLPVDDHRWMRGLIVLHELAHHLNQSSREHHGPRFLAAFGELLEAMFDRDLRASFEADLNGVA